jgi:predicted dehydrogenase
VTAAAPPLGVGIIGFGFMGRTHAAGYRAALAAGLPVVLRAVTAAPEMETPEGAERLPDAAAILAREDIGAVSLCTYTDSHVELGLAALAAGKHLLVEKPVALRSADVARLAGAAATSGLICMPAMCMRFWRGWPWLRDRVTAGTFGAVQSAEFSRVSSRPDWGAAFYRSPERSGSALFDLHIHDVDFIRWCFGHPASVAAAGSIEDVRGSYGYPGPERVEARGAWLSDPATRFSMRYAVRFDEAEVRFDLADSAPLSVLRGGIREEVLQPAGSAYDAEVRHFVELVLGRVAGPVATLEEALAVTGILEMEARCLAAGGSVAPPSHPG